MQHTTLWMNAFTPLHLTCGTFVKPSCVCFRWLYFINVNAYVITSATFDKRRLAFTCACVSFDNNLFLTFNETAFRNRSWFMPVWFCSVISARYVFMCKIVFLTYSRCLVCSAQPCYSYYKPRGWRLDSTCRYLKAAPLISSSSTRLFEMSDVMFDVRISHN